MRHSSSPVFTRDESAYQDGRRAFRDGMGTDACPHLKGDARYSWLLGMLDARTEAFCQRLEKMGVRDGP